MPRATLSMAPTKLYLKHCPEGWVDLRRMSFGELLASQDLAYQVSAKANESRDDPELSMNMSQMAVYEYQFKTCIVDHNLEDEHGTKLNFAASPQSVHMLDPLVGQEIVKKIDLMHRLEQNYPNSEKPSTNGSSTTDAVKMATTSAPQATLPTSS
jgi:hypothetical protein